MFEAAEVLRVLTLLRTAGCEVWIGGGWGIDALVGRVTREHRDLDLAHRAEQEPVVIGTLEQAGYAETGDALPCLSAAQQVHFHQGYEPTDRDRHDMAQLRAAFGGAAGTW
ncbi:nucleotidyltransferase domain-containing protein [Planotetraspora sp. GP83]|uniref:nucleotidyltransferase domain-containing protein n=1 Tax=Planotetraspora sp. GP83 TaxID=3156264 RepID=UPI003516BC01